MKAEKEIVGKALVGVSYLASVQFSSRIFTFLLNIALTRYMQDPAALGVASIQLYLLYTLALNLSRETIRRVCLRLASESVKTHEVVNLIWCGIVLGVIITPMLCLYFITYVDEEARKGIPLNEYTSSIWIVGLSIIIELLSEPMFVLAQGQLQYSSRSLFEAVAVILKCLFTVFAAVFLKMHLTAFAVGYAAYSLSLLLSYSWLFKRQFSRGNENVSRNELWSVNSFVDLCPSKGLKVTSPELINPAWSFFKQTILKLVLSEGEKIVMVALAMDPSDQAVYAVVFNLGSLVARFVFQPVEEVAFTIFGKLNDIRKRKAKLEVKSINDENLHELDPVVLLQTFSKLMFLVGIVFASFGPNYSHLLLYILYGEKYSETSAPSALSWYCLYVLVIAMNGITEAFVHAVADEATLDLFNRWLVLCSVVFLASAAVLLRFGAIGLVIANSINMILRILFSARYILTWKNRRSLSKGVGEFLPGWIALSSFAAAFLATAASSQYIYRTFSNVKSTWIHILVGLGALIFCLAILFRTENRLFKDVRDLIRQRKKNE